MGPPKRRATYEDLMQVPDTKVAEIIDGELVVSPRPASPHAHAATVLGSDVTGPFHRGPGDPAGPGGWWILLEPELHLAEDVLVPDWAGWQRDRLPVFPDTPAFTQAPDWVCEVISPSTGRIDRSRKMRIYAREGVSHLWFVEPQLETLEIYRLESGRWVVVGTHAGDEAVRAEPFDAVELRLGRWWMPRNAGGAVVAPLPRSGCTQGTPRGSTSCLADRAIERVEQLQRLRPEAPDGVAEPLLAGAYARTTKARHCRCTLGDRCSRRVGAVFSYSIPSF